MQNIRYFWAFFAVAVGGIVSGCSLDNKDKIFIGNGIVITKERNITGFNGIVLDGLGKAVITPGEEYKVMITTDSNIQDIVELNINDNLLHISQRNAPGYYGFDATELTFNISLPVAENIQLKGVGNIMIQNGNTQNLTITLSGVGGIDAQNYQAENVNVILSGIGNIKTWAINTLEGKLSGVGDILYKGNPTIQINNDGIGKIEEIAEK